MTPFSHSLILQELVKGVTSATQPRFVSQRTDVIETVVEDTDHGLNDGEKGMWFVKARTMTRTVRILPT